MIIKKEKVGTHLKEKWLDIIKTKIDLSDLSEDNILELCGYCEHHNICEQVFEQSEALNGLLGVGLNIISKLDLKGKTLLYTHSPKFIYTESVGDDNGKSVVKEKEFSIGAYEETLDVEVVDDSDYRHAEKILCDKVAEKINIKLKYHDTVVLYLIPQSISLSSDKRLFLRYRISFHDRVDDAMSVYNVIKSTNTARFLPKNVGNIIGLEKTDVITGSSCTEEELYNLIEDLEKEVCDKKNYISEIKKFMKHPVKNPFENLSEN